MDTDFNDRFEHDEFSIEQVKQLFHCLVDNDDNLLKKCCDFLNNSLIDDDSTINNNVSSQKTTFRNGECETEQQQQQTEIHFESRNDEFEQIISSLSQNIRQIQLEFNQHNNNNKNPTTTINCCELFDSFFNKSNQIQSDLVKIKKFLILKSTSGEEKRCRKHSTCGQSYNNYINRILGNRFFFLQLLHFECIILHYLKCFSQQQHTFSNNNLSNDILLSQMQCLFRNYYTLIIKLSYEPPFVQSVRSLHPKSSIITCNILCYYLKLLDHKLIRENSQNNQQELVDTIINNRSIVIILDYLIILNRLELLDFKTEIFPNIIAGFGENQSDFDKIIQIIQEYFENNPDSSLLSSQINLVRFGNLILRKFGSLNKFIEKSTLRSRTILMLFNVCRKLRCDSDRFCSSWILLPTVIELLEHCNQYHREICEQKSALNLNKDDIDRLEIGEKLIEKDSQLKLYLSILRDIYGILSLLLTFTESSITNEYFRSLKIGEIIFQKFMQPFVCSLNGTEHNDPIISDDNYRQMKINTISEAYKISNLYRKQYDRIIHYTNRLVVMSSMFIQRLLPSLLIPLDDNRNPFTFQYNPHLPKATTIVEQISEDQGDYDDDEEQPDLEIYPVGSDEECLESDLFSESELEDTTSNDNNKKKSEEIDSSLARSYLGFFPEIKFNCSNDDNELKLSCSCDQDCSKPIFKQQPTNISTFIRPDKIDDFDWKKTFTAIYDSIKTVQPKQVIPTPELNNCHQQNSVQIHPMTYPFLKNAIRLKNYHHIKLLDHVGQRLFPLFNNSEYNIVYDIEKPVAKTMDDEKFLKFESRFECGNLRKALFIQQSNPNENNEQEYLLILNPDINCTSHTQWFYFQVKQMQTNHKYRFKIINCEKKSILFNNGQQPLFYSCREYEKCGKTWQRIHDNEPMTNNKYIVAYYRNHYVKNKEFKNLFKAKLYYTLEFTFTFPYENDECYFAFNIPFSYSQLQTNICYWSYLVDNHNRKKSVNPGDQILFISQTLCSSLKGNDLPVITITSNDKFDDKHYIMITARVHPSESNSSWKELLDKYIFKIIPMLNPDGVINGCTRTDLQTEDLNRHWMDPSPILHPTIYHSKMLLQCLHTYSGGRNPVAFLDIHGHSRRHNIFSYSCFPLLSWKKSDQQNYFKKHLQKHLCVCTDNTTCKLIDQLESIKNEMNDDDEHVVNLAMPPFLTIPLVLQYQQSPAFNPDYCSFAMQKDREQTARLVAYRQYGINLAYTIECSASGCDRGPYAGQNLSIIQMQEMGHFLAKSFNLIKFIYCSSKHFPLIQFIPESIDDTTTKCKQGK
ncbi:Cytosolic carboxypeptidase 1 [Dermatophagoides pteronyssinus]|uniref:Cytosolic carboxypeptidase 1 n=1 Tax=Dermatophagoides pteronyssinus TaxID=6956 RepID=A0ABQ8JW89_DERPT|nr:Cytosolic carboxypeptidase 1 [Dermatophagoides pteronyssinus]